MYMITVSKNQYEVNIPSFHEGYQDSLSSNVKKTTGTFNCCREIGRPENDQFCHRKWLCIFGRNFKKYVT